MLFQSQSVAVFNTTNTMLWWRSLAVIIFCLHFSHNAAIVPHIDFKRICLNPPNLGIGKYEETQCTVRFPFNTGSDTEAMEMCHGAMPFQIKEATPGETTKCVYEKQEVDCDEGETPIGLRCFNVKGRGLFLNYSTACLPKYIFHVIETDFDKQWIPLRISQTYEDIWVGISGEYFATKHPIAMKPNRTKRAVKQIVTTRKGKILKLHLEGKDDSMYVKGKLLPALKEDQAPYLCSRPGKLKSSEEGEEGKEKKGEETTHPTAPQEKTAPPTKHEQTHLPTKQVTTGSTRETPGNRPVGTTRTTTEETKAPETTKAAEESTEQETTEKPNRTTKRRKHKTGPQPIGEILTLKPK